MPDAHANFAWGTVLTGPSPSTTGTSLVLGSGHGARMPTVPFNATVWNSTGQPVDASGVNGEIIRVTALAGDTVTTMLRTQEGTSARAITTGDQFAASITKKTLTDVEGAQRLDELVVAAADCSTSTKTLADYVCDGTDDHVEIQAAIDALAATGKPSLVPFASGIVRCTGQKFVLGAHLHLKSGIEVCGDGSGATMLIPKIGYADTDIVTLDTVNVERTSLRSIAVNGRKADGITTNGVTIDNTGGVFAVGPDPLHKIEDVWVHDCDGTGMTIGVNCRGTRVLDLDISNCTHHGLYLTATDCKVELVRVISCGTDDATMTYYGIGDIGANNQILGFKANFQRGHNVYIDAVGSILQGQSQDAWGAGFYFGPNSNACFADVIADSNGMQPQAGIAGSDSNIHIVGGKHTIRGITKDRGFAESQVDVNSNPGSRAGWGLSFDPTTPPQQCDVNLIAKTLRRGSVTGPRAGYRHKVSITDDLLIGDVQIVNLPVATGGTFKLTDTQSGQQTAAINFSTNATTLRSNAQTALQALAALGANVSVNSASFAYQFKIIFTGALANTFRSTFTVDASALTPGGAPAAAKILHAIEGGARTSETRSDNNGYIHVSTPVSPVTDADIGNGVAVWEEDAGTGHLTARARNAAGALRTIDVETPSDATQKSTLTTKGDTYAATAASTPARLGVGTHLTQRVIADTATATGLKWVPHVIGLSVDATPITNNTLADTALTMPIAANEIWVYQVMLFYNAANVTMDCKATFTAPSGATGAWGTVGVNTFNGFAPIGTGSTQLQLKALAASDAWGSPTGGESGVYLGCRVVNSSTPGSVTLQFAQNTTDAGNLTIKAGSSMIGWRVA